MYQKQKKILLKNANKSCCFILWGQNNIKISSIAKSFATWLLKTNTSNHDLCLLKEKKIKLQDALKLKNFFTLSSAESDQKVAIFCNLQQITKSASNALLKTLEEPSQNRKVMIVANNLYNIPATLISRCITLFFPDTDSALLADKDNKLIPTYISLLKIIRGKQPNKLPFNVENKLIFLTLSRIIKYLHKLLTEELFQGEFEALKDLNQDKIFWHHLYKKSLSFISCEADLCIQKFLYLLYKY